MRLSHPSESDGHAIAFLDRDFRRHVNSNLRHPCIAPFDAPSAPPAARNTYQCWLREHRHAHPFYEVMIVVRGDCCFALDEQVFRLAPGSVAVVAPNQPHVNRYRPGEDDLRQLWISFVTPEQAFLQVVDVRRGRRRWQHAGRSLMPVGTLSRRLVEIERSSGASDPLRRRLLLHAVYAEMMGGLLDIAAQATGSIDREAILRHKVAMVCRHIADAGRLNMSLADLAHLAGYSPPHFARVFKRVTGHTVHQHITARRIETARRRLEEGIPLKTMAAELGFSDKTTLSRWINKHRRAICD